tara:strand:- start:6355 stop:6921 length:567 start_codon:yes stop_codon:yes gene_type:complete
MNRTSINTTHVNDILNVNDILDTDDIFEVIDIKTAPAYNEPFPRQAFQIEDTNNNKSKYFKLLYIILGLFVLSSSLFSGFYFFYLNGKPNSNDNFSNTTLPIMLSYSISPSLSTTISTSTLLSSTTLSLSPSPSISSSISSSISASLTIYYNYYVDNRPECITYSTYWCHHSCNHHPPICPNCCIKIE